MLVFPNKKYFGVNVENCSYSLTTCAEKNCITSAITDGVNLKDALYIVIGTNSADTITPCGACRQILSEFFDEDFMVYTFGKTATTPNEPSVNVYRLGDLLPAGFIK
jgi:cytidine deaminase